MQNSICNPILLEGPRVILTVVEKPFPSAKKKRGGVLSIVWFGLVWFYGISTIVGYLMPNPLYTYILNIYDLVWFGFMAYQPL